MIYEENAPEYDLRDKIATPIPKESKMKIPNSVGEDIIRK